MKGRLYTMVMHVIGWVIFITLPAMMLPRPQMGPMEIPVSLLLLLLSLTALPLIAFFYANLLVFLPRFYLQRRYGYYGLAVVVCVDAILGFSALLYFNLPWIQDLFHGRLNIILLGTGYRTMVVLIFSFGLFVYQRWRLAEDAKAQAELSYLKAQINPHFLFNTLNSIYYLALQQSERAPSAVEKLSAIMRYVIDEGKQNRVPLEREVSYLHDYIVLQKLRFTDNVQIDLQVTGDLVGKEIAPLILVSFVENAFKHGISMEANSPIHIALAVSSDHIRFTVRNHKFGSFADTAAESGIGLENTRRRLEIAYPGRHHLAIVENPEEYTVTLEINNR
ncbi:MAG: histidine kinase [Bacteroidia bacterium]|nr:histidine kinase [Bacteroidia bacterium]